MRQSASSRIGPNAMIEILARSWKAVHFHILDTSLPLWSQRCQNRLALFNTPIKQSVIWSGFLSISDKALKWSHIGLCQDLIYFYNSIKQPQALHNVNISCCCMNILHLWCHRVKFSAKVAVLCHTCQLHYGPIDLAYIVNVGDICVFLSSSSSLS